MRLKYLCYACAFLGAIALILAIFFQLYSKDILHNVQTPDGSTYTNVETIRPYQTPHSWISLGTCGVLFLTAFIISRYVPDI